MYRQLAKVKIAYKRAKVLLELILKLSIKAGYCYSGSKVLSKIMCCSIATTERAIKWLRERGYILIEYRRRCQAKIYPNYEKIEQEINEMRDQESKMRDQEPSVDNLWISSHNTVDNLWISSILDPSFCGINLQLYITVILKPVICLLRLRSKQPIFTDEDSPTANSQTAERSQIEEIPTKVERLQSVQYACRTLFKKVSPKPLSEEIDTIAEIGKYFNSLTGNRLNYNQIYFYLKFPCANGLTYQEAVNYIKAKVHECKEKECDIAGLHLGRLFDKW